VEFLDCVLKLNPLPGLAGQIRLIKERNRLGPSLFMQGHGQGIPQLTIARERLRQERIGVVVRDPAKAGISVEAKQGIRRANDLMKGWHSRRADFGKGFSGG
jgi:hypothetical protein